MKSATALKGCMVFYLSVSFCHDVIAVPPSQNIQNVDIGNIQSQTDAQRENEHPSLTGFSGTNTGQAIRESA
jgi:hypothetical protein